MTLAEIGSIVRSARRAQHLRQDELAGAAGVGVRFLSELERGKTTVRFGKVLAVLEALGCTLHIEAPQIGRDGVTRVEATEAPWIRRRRLRRRAGGRSRL